MEQSYLLPRLVALFKRPNTLCLNVRADYGA